MMRILLLAMALAACAPPQTSEESAPAAAEPSAPSPQVVTVRINHAQRGQSVDVAVSRYFSVELNGEAAQGRVWSPVDLPDFIAPSADGAASLPPRETPEDAPVVGGGNADVFFLVANAPGTGELVFRERNFGGDILPNGDTFRVTIVAR